jgi:chromosome partitioning protein
VAVISVMSPKGGAGKTTLTFVLACQFAAAGARVAVIDADPNQPIANWKEGRGAKRTPFDVVASPSTANALDVGRAIRAADADHDIVLVDLEGTASRLVASAVVLSNLVLTPVKPSALDAAEAAKAVGLVAELAEGADRDIPHTLVFTNVPAALQSRSYRSIAEQLRAAEIDVLPVQLVDREAYRACFMFKRTIDELTSQQVSNIQAARENAGRLAEAVLATLTGEETPELEGAA